MELRDDLPIENSQELWHTHNRHKDEADQLRANPGKWGKIADFDAVSRKAADNLAYRIKNQYVAFRPHGAFEARVITTGKLGNKITVDSRFEVWVRYVGDNNTQED